MHDAGPTYAFLVYLTHMASLRQNHHEDVVAHLDLPTGGEKEALYGAAVLMLECLSSMEKARDALLEGKFVQAWEALKPTENEEALRKLVLQFVDP
jgi:hypothetical protein